MSVEVSGGPKWREEMDRRIAAGRQRLEPLLKQSPELRAYVQRTLNEHSYELTGIK